MTNRGLSVPDPAKKSDLSKFLSEPILVVRDLPEEVRNKKFLPQLLDRLEQAGRLRRVRRGAYLVIPSGQSPSTFSVDPYVVTAVVGPRSAVSFYSALALRGLTESIGSRITLQTATHFAKFTFDGIEIVPVVTRHLFGFETVYRSGVRVQVTDVERTILDGLRNPSDVGGLDEFLRALEGVERSNLLALILEHVLTTSKLPQWTRFRATYDDRREELNQLANANLVKRIDNEIFFLGVVGLSYCPHTAAESEMANVRKMFSYLRAKYKETPGKTTTCAQAAVDLGLNQNGCSRAALCLALSNIGVEANPGTQGQLPQEISVREPVLDCVDIDQVLARHRRDPKPVDLKLRKTSVVSVRFEKMLEYLGLFGETSLYSKAGFILRLFEQRWKPTSDVFSAIQNGVGKRKIYFPQDLPKGSGRFIREWNLIVPMHVHSRYVAATGGAQNVAL